MRVTMDSRRITYTPRPDATPEAELDALASVFRFVLECHAKTEGRPTTSGPDDAKEITSVRARHIVPEEP